MKRFVRLLSLFLAVLFVFCSCTTPNEQSTDVESSGDSEVSYDPENANRTLISVGKPYKSVVPASSSYADYNGQQLTDGHKTPNTQVHYTDPRMVGYTSDGQFILDLGEDGKRITEIALRAFEFYSDGVKLPTHVRYSGSNDGENWEGIDTAYFIPQGDRSVCVAKVVLDKPTDYRYIKIRVYKSAAFFFMDEIEVYADVPANKNVSLLEAYKNENIDKSAWKALSTSKKAEYSVSANIAYAKQCAYADCNFDNRAPAEGEKRNEKLQTFLTDGKPTGRFFGEDYWVGFTGKDGASPKITVNLGESYDNVYGFRVHAMGVGPDVVYPDYIDVYGSKDAKDYVLLGRVYAPAGGTHFAYTLILKEFVNVKSVRFEFGGNGNFWVEEVEVLAGYEDEVLNEMFPPLNLPEVTEDIFWPATEADYTKYQNLLKGVKMHVAAAHYADILTYGKNTAPATNTALTDGKRAVTTDRGTGEYFYMQGGMGYNFFFDMGKVASVDKLVLSFLEYKDWAINRPKFCDVFLSDDGVNWYKVGTRNASDDGEAKNNYRGTYEFVLDKTYSARFVRLRVEANGWLYLEEMEAFGTKAVTGKTVRLADSGMDSVIFYSNYDNAQYATTENTPIKAEDITLVYLDQKDLDNPKENM
ncbi:MAG: discoidin domain-containing protein, partial [Clostridia bacterium]|nr:discoidin domain-containing protein [Clostridia bacterium]